jgi:hypothetical protein
LLTRRSSRTPNYFETADAVETVRNSGLIKPLSSRMLTDISVSAASTTVTSAVARSSAADVGRTFNASATSFTALIIGYVSPTQITLKNAPGTAVVAGDTVYVGKPTGDGLHYWPEAEVLMAADLSWDQLGVASY